jgi:hypothetical protein
LDGALTADKKGRGIVNADAEDVSIVSPMRIGGKYCEFVIFVQ